MPKTAAVSEKTAGATASAASASIVPYSTRFCVDSFAFSGNLQTNPTGNAYSLVGNEWKE